MSRHQIMDVVVKVLPLGLNKRIGALETWATDHDSSRKSELMHAKEKQDELDIRLDAIEAEARLQRLALEVGLRLDAKGNGGSR
jgi:hypothetical protein